MSIVLMIGLFGNRFTITRSIPQLLFLRERIIITTTNTITAITIKIPKPIPALKIPAIASQELKNTVISDKANTVRSFEFFIGYSLNDEKMQKKLL